MADKGVSEHATACESPAITQRTTKIESNLNSRAREYLHTIMKTYIINMEAAHSRRERIANTLAPTGIDFEFFRAITPADEPRLRHFTGFSNFTIWLETGRTTVNATEVAVYSSHLLLWQKCIDLNEPIVILEDDLKTTAQFHEAYAVLEELTQKYGFIRLDPVWPHLNYFRRGQIIDARTLLAARAGSVRLIHPTYISLGAAAYAISPAAAKRLLEVSINKKFSCPVDNFFRRTWAHRQPMFYLEPPPYELDSTSEATQIGGRNMGRPNSKLIRKMRKITKRPYQMWAKYASRRESSRVRILLGIDSTISQS